MTSQETSRYPVLPLRGLLVFPTLTLHIDVGRKKSMAALQAALPFEIIPFDRAQAQTAASLRPPTKALGLSLGDRACLALAIERQAVALTADRVWQTLKIEGLSVELLR